MNKKGFTLVELIATIALLGIISIISFVSISAVLEESKVNNCNILVDNITNATKEYVSDNRYNFENNDDFSISLAVLISGNYLSSPIEDPFSSKDIDPTKVNVSIELNSDYSAKTIVVKINDEVINCEDEGIEETFKSILK